MKVGVLALQGGFAEHIAALNKLNVPYVEIRKKEDFDDTVEALILPGGESTVIGKLLHQTGLFAPIQERIQNGMPVWGTCAGLILLANRISNEEHPYLKGIDITACRNAYGRQLGSFEAQEEFRGIGILPMTFIRAPFIESIGKGVTPLSFFNGKITAAENDTILVTAYHPELTDNTRILEYFLQKACKRI
ncbi:MAG: pyridoxal 5'-phosphate synthase glutaminase subunit PdxT [Clostridium sp.]|uniref:pyridoxal 5'-phosphate synthase glutaminase subunit PdxT n=1 Tax=Clostridium sp. TaxID=1506 RepID=UPI00290C2F04|nr:pyridoxal 5'-phosphate synthase glutaminase subunit PdxT [Clostridium sp.]MDU7336897.1 pyridoxal 5'-phosphate synthase glutaminase subunit PdxT [Clostridium sp.]